MEQQSLHRLASAASRPSTGRLPAQELALEQMRSEAVGQEGLQPGGKSQLGKRKAIYNTETLHDLLEDLEYSKDTDWHETQVVMAEEAEPLEDVDDDLSRELSFYNQARTRLMDTVQRRHSPCPWAGRPTFWEAG